MADRILVTGANGFVGSALCRQLYECGFVVRGTVRTLGIPLLHQGSESVTVERVELRDESTEEQMKRALDGVQVLVHLAARVHVMADAARNPLQEFRRVNVRWTERLARVAALQGVLRIVYLSTVKVNGEHTILPFTEQDPPHPEDPYGVSKWEAEQTLARVSRDMGLETVIVRSPLIYGPGVQGNFLQLLKVVRSRIPFPLAGIRNQRSLIYRGNLVEALIRCVKDTRAAGQTYLVSDGEDLSTPELIQRLGSAMGVKVHLWSMPTPLLRWSGRIAGKRGIIDRLIESLQVDSSKIRRELDWRPSFSIDTGFQETAAWFRTQSSLCLGC